MQRDLNIVNFLGWNLTHWDDFFRNLSLTRFVKLIQIAWRLAMLLLTHWDRVTHTCVGKLTIIGSDNGLSPGRRQAIIWTNAGILLIGPLGTYFSEFLIAIETFSFKKMHLKISSAKWRPFCLGLNVSKHEREGHDHVVCLSVSLLVCKLNGRNVKHKIQLDALNQFYAWW